MERYKISEYRKVKEHLREFIKETKTLNQPEHIIAHIKFLKEIKREVNDFLISRGYVLKKDPAKSTRRPYRKV